MKNELTVFVGETPVVLIFNEEMGEFIIARGVKQELADVNPLDVARALRGLGIKHTIANCRHVVTGMKMMLEW